MPRFRLPIQLSAIACLLFLAARPASAASSAWLGFLDGPATPTPALAKVAQAATRQEVRLMAPGGLAEKAGVKPGDVLLYIGGQPTINAKAVELALEQMKVGDAVRVSVLRGEQRLEIAVIAQARPGPDALVKMLQKRGEAGSPEALRELGRLLNNGAYGVAKDKTEAARWFRKPAEQGDAIAQVNLGYLYQIGEGVEKKDEAQAFGWFRKAGEQGNAVGQCALAQAYFNSIGVTKDDAEALRWFR
jgi:TPR repeat protein